MGPFLSGVPCSDLSGLAAVVPAEGFEFFSEWATRECFKEVRQGWMGLEVGLWHDKVVSCGLQRYEIQVELLRRGSNPDSHFCLALGNSPCDVDMCRCDAVISLNVCGLYPSCS